MNLPSKTATTRDRLLEAASVTFATQGYIGATTREIARTAGVSEVTLFRHFQSKEQLLGAVAQQMSELATTGDGDEWTTDLRATLANYAQRHDALLEQHQALIRMFIGEAQRHPDESVCVLQQIFMPLRVKFVAYLADCIQRGSVSPEIEPTAAADRFTGMLLAGMLRRHVMPIDRGYSRAEYVDGCVYLFIRAIGTTASNSAQLSPIS